MSEKFLRMGPVTILTFLILLVLAVMAVLGVSTVNAQNAIAERQKATVSATYANEASAQALLAYVDEALGGQRDAEGWNQVRAALPDAAAAQQAVDRFLAAVDMEATQVTALSWENGTLSATFECEEFRQLNVAVAFDEEAGYVVTQWSTATLWEEDEGTGLWDGK